MGFGPKNPAAAEISIGIAGDALAGAANTWRAFPMGDVAVIAGDTTDTQWVVPRAYTLIGLRARLNSQPAAGVTCIIGARINGVNDTTLDVTFNNTHAALTQLAATGEISLVAGDLLSFRATTSAALPDNRWNASFIMRPA